MRVIILSSVVEIGIAIVSYYVLGGMAVDAAAALSEPSVRL
jgi:hypothetical protein